jgi:hypothetical protein
LTDPAPEERRIPRWQNRETWIVLALIAVFFVAGQKIYRERRLIAASERLKADMQMFALGINTYQTEEGAYPVPETPVEPGIRTAHRVPATLTSPVAYVNRLMTDPFAGGDTGEVLRYIRKDDTATSGGDLEFEAFVRDSIGDPVQGVDYVFWSRGPDGDLDSQVRAEGKIRTVRYDPTNGAKSDGDLLFWGPAIGVRRNPYLGTAAAGRGGLQ